MGLIRYNLCFSVLIIAIIGSAQARPLADPAPGEFICDKVSPSVYVTGICTYQARPYGNAAFDNLLVYAQKRVSDDFTTVGNPKVQRPVALDRAAGKISWWFPDDAANQEFGRALSAADTMTTILEKDGISVTLAMYSFDKRYSRDFGIDLGFFLGRGGDASQPAQSTFGALKDGVFNLHTAIGNPLVSYLTSAIRAQVEKKQASVIKEFPFPRCEVGSYCSHSDNENYYVSTTAITPISEKLGISISYRPRISTTDPTLVTLQDLKITYATATGDKDAPVSTLVPYDYTSLTLHTDEVYTIGSETSSRDVRTGRLLSGGKETGHTQFIMMIKVNVIKAGRNAPTTGIAFPEPLSGGYSAVELKELDRPEMSLREVLESLKLTCSPDYVNLATTKSEPICGYRLEKMAKKFIHYRVKVSVGKRGSRRGIDTRVVELGELYRGKGYYRLPVMSATKPDDRYEFRAELDRTGTIGNDTWERESIKGVQFGFSYFPGSGSPIDMDPQERPDLLNWIQ